MYLDMCLNLPVEVEVRLAGRQEEQLEFFHPSVIDSLHKLGFVGCEATDHHNDQIRRTVYRTLQDGLGESACGVSSCSTKANSTRGLIDDGILRAKRRHVVLTSSFRSAGAQVVAVS